MADDGYGADASKAPKAAVPEESKKKATKRTNALLQENERARALDQYDARTDDVVHAFGDTFYRDYKRDDPSDPMLIQVNHLKPWAATYLAALSYGRFTPSVLASAQRQLPPEFATLAPEAIRRLLDDLLNSEDLVAKTRRAALLSLLRGDAAYYVDIDWQKAQEDPIKGISIDVIGRKDLLIDRCSKQSRVSYIGMMLSAPLKIGLTDGKRSESEAEEQPSYAQQDPLRKTYVYLYDLDRSMPVDPNPNAPEADDAEEKLGIYTCACVESSNTSDPRHFTVKEILDYEPIPYVGPDGSPIAPIVPVQLTPHPDFPLRGQPEALTPYNLVASLNQLRSWQNQKSRADSTSILAYDPERVDQEDKDAILSGALTVEIPLKAGQNGVNYTRPALEWVAPSMTPDSSKVLDAALQQDRSTTLGISPLLMGQQQGKGYATATEASASAAYSEASMAPLRVTLNQILCQLSQVILCMIAHACRETGLPGVKILNPDQSVTDIPVEWLLYPWNITMDNTGSTPMADQQDMNVWLQIYPMLEEMLTTYAQAAGGGMDEMGMPIPGNPMLAAFLETAYKHTIEKTKLPAQFRWDSLKAKLIAPPADMMDPMAPAPGQVVEEPPPDQMPIPDDVAAIMQGGQNV